MAKILITDSLFIADNHIVQLQSAGHEPIRLDKVKATEAELIEAIQGCEGYILGGIEEVTKAVIDAATDLKVISFTGADYATFIPAHAHATSRAIKITNCPGANAQAVAEYTLALTLMMARHVPELTAPDGKTFFIASEFSELTVGVIGYGHIGQIVCRLLKALGFKVIVTTRSGSSKIEADGFTHATLDELATQADIVTLHVDALHGTNLLNRNKIKLLKNGAIVINTCHGDALDQTALLERVRKGELYAATDPVKPVDMEGVLPSQYVQSRTHVAYNAKAANNRASDMATQSIINVLAGEDDRYIVNR